MAFRLRRSLKLLPGLRLNLSKGGVSLSAGIPGAHINFSPRGARTTFGVPGSGFSWSTSLKSGQVPRRYSSPETPGGIRPIKTTAELEAAVQIPSTKVVYSRTGRRASSQQLQAEYRRLARETVNQEIRPTPRAIPLLIAILCLAAGILLGVLDSRTEGGSAASYALLVLAPVVSLGGLGASILIYRTKNRARTRLVEAEVVKRAEEQWPVKERTFGVKIQRRTERERPIAKAQTNNF